MSLIYHSHVLRLLVLAVVCIAACGLPATAQQTATNEAKEIADKFLKYARGPSSGLAALLSEVRDFGAPAHPYFREYLASLDLSQPRAPDTQVSVYLIGQIFYVIAPAPGDTSVARAIIRETMEKDISDDYRKFVYKDALDCLAKVGQVEDQDLAYLGLRGPNPSAAAEALAAIGNEEGLAHLKAHIEQATEGRPIVNFYTGIVAAQMTKAALDMDIRLLNSSLRRSTSDEEKIELRDKLTDVEMRLEIWQARYDAHYFPPEERAAALTKLEALLAARKTIPAAPEPEIPDEATPTQIASVQEPLPIFPKEVGAIPETVEPAEDTEPSSNKVFALVFIAALALLAGVALVARVLSRR